MVAMLGGDNEVAQHTAQVHELDQRAKPPVKLTKRTRENADMKDVISTLLNEEEGDEVHLAFQAMAKQMRKQLQPIDIDECMMELQEVVNRYARMSRRQNQPTSTVTSAAAQAQHVSIPTRQPMLPMVHRDDTYYRDENSTYYNM